MPRRNTKSLSFDQLSFFTLELIKVEKFLRPSITQSALLEDLVMEGLEAGHKRRFRYVKGYSVLWDCSFGEAWFRIITDNTPPPMSEMSEEELQALERRIQRTGVGPYTYWFPNAL